MIAKSPIVNALTVDVEDYFHATSFEDRISRYHWDRIPSRVVQNTQRLLHLMEAQEVHATFFILGWVAERFPKLVRQIAAAGHEIGCHSYWHRLVYKLTPEEFRNDVRHSRAILEGITGERVLSFRAPTFSITKQSLWALDILVEEGFRYDSSIFPIYHDRYGIPDANPFPHRIHNGPTPLWEFPGSVYQFWRFNLPISGGGYFRLYPAGLTARWLARINRRCAQPFMFYIHPWEIDPDQPRLTTGGWDSWRHYLNLETTERKFQWLLTQFRFARLDEVLDTHFPIPDGTTNKVPRTASTALAVTECP